jgi:hypothetical protein
MAAAEGPEPEQPRYGEEGAEWRQVFAALDVNSNGYLTANEIQKWAVEHGGCEGAQCVRACCVSHSRGASNSWLIRCWLPVSVAACCLMRCTLDVL